jgi:hypothetical protein
LVVWRWGQGWSMLEPVRGQMFSLLLGEHQ